MTRSRLSALAILVLLAVWMASGLFRAADEPASAAHDLDDAPTTVTVRTVTPEPVAREIRIHGALEPLRSVMLRAETDARVLTVPAAKGARVTENEVLVRLDPGSRAADRAEAVARERSARRALEAAMALDQRGLQPEVELESLRSDVATAAATRARIELEIERLAIRAPFEGTVQALSVERGAWVSTGESLVELLVVDRLLAVGSVNQQEVGLLSAEQPATVRLLSGERLDGRVRFIAPRADAATRSFRVEAVVDNREGHHAAGASATLVLPIEPQDAVFLSPAVLALDDTGRLGVKLVDADDRIRFRPVEIVSSTLDGTWISGLEAGDRVVVLGQGFVAEGEAVVARPEAASEAASESAPAAMAPGGPG